MWNLLALVESELELVDVIDLNLAVAREIATIAQLDVSKYISVVDQWTADFRQRLPEYEGRFRAAPWKWKHDIRFFRIGMLQGFLGQEIGIRYVEDQKNVKSVRYTDPGQLFLHGLIDTKQGTCGNMAALHVAIARRMGWPVSLACVRSHLISRFDDGEVTYNIEATSTHPGAFASDPDEVYIQRFKLPERAIACRSDLRKLTAREMLGVFVALRARYYADTGNSDEAERDYLLARYLFPQYRAAYAASIPHIISRGNCLFDRHELGHPSSVRELLNAY